MVPPPLAAHTAPRLSSLHAKSFEADLSPTDSSAVHLVERVAGAPCPRSPQLAVRRLELLHLGVERGGLVGERDEGRVLCL